MTFLPAAAAVEWYLIIGKRAFQNRFRGSVVSLPTYRTYGARCACFTWLGSDAAVSSTTIAAGASFSGEEVDSDDNEAAATAESLSSAPSDKGSVLALLIDTDGDGWNSEQLLLPLTPTASLLAVVVVVVVVGAGVAGVAVGATGGVVLPSPVRRSTGVAAAFPSAAPPPASTGFFLSWFQAKKRKEGKKKKKEKKKKEIRYRQY